MAAADWGEAGLLELKVQAIPSDVSPSPPVPLMLRGAFCDATTSSVRGCPRAVERSDWPRCSCAAHRGDHPVRTHEM